jgi:hypothetical protein
MMSKYDKTFEYVNRQRKLLNRPELSKSEFARLYCVKKYAVSLIIKGDFE